MKKLLRCVVTIAAVAAVAAGVSILWMNRPWRSVASVNGHSLSYAEFNLRSRVLLDDAKKIEKLIIPAGREQETLRHYQREAAKLWITKEVLLSEALARGYMVTPEDEAESLKRFSAQLNERGMTSEQFFKEGMLGEDLKRREYRESILINKFTNEEVRKKIRIDDKEIDERINELKRIALMTTKPGKQVELPTRKRAVDSIRGEKYLAMFRELFRSSFEKCDVRCVVFPDLEKLSEKEKQSGK